MLVTVLKTLNGDVAVKAEQKITTLEDLVIFTTRFGVGQDFEELVLDFQEYSDRTYIVGLDCGQ
jgi:hypothetical protein